MVGTGPSDASNLGLNILHSKLQQGCVENQQVIQIAKLRADAEEAYGTKLIAIPPAAIRANGFEKDEGASVRKVDNRYWQ